MEPEDLPWPGELEEEEEEEEETEEAEERANLDSDEVVMVEEVEEEERRELDSHFNYESQPRERTDEEDDEEAKAWLQAHPEGPLRPSSLSRHRYSEDERTGPEKVVPLTCHVWQQPLYQGNSGTQISDTTVVSVEKTARWRSKADQGTESWHYLPQEMDSSHTLDITQTRFNMREEGTEVTDFTSVEEGILTQPENQVKEAKRGLLCSPLLVIQDNFASPDLPLLTCLTQDQEFGSDSLFQQSELDFAPLRGIPGKSEDTEWFSRPSEVSEALFQAASEVASDLVNSCISVSQHSLIASTAECQRSFLPFEQGTKEDAISSDTVDELKTPKGFDRYDALCSYMAWKTQEVQEPETSLADKGQDSVSTSSYTSDDYVTPEGSDSFDASCSHVQYWKQKALQQSENYLTSGDHDSYSDSSDIIDKNKIPKGSDNFRAPFSCTPWSKQEASHHPETYVISKDCVCFPHEVAPHFNNKMSHSLLHCLLERRGKGIPLTAHSHYFESVYLRAPAENEVKGMMDSLEGYERNEEGLGKELSQGFELKENRSTLVFSEMHPRSSDTQFIENVVVPDNSVKVSEIHIHSRQHGTSKMEVSGGPLQTIKSNLDETSEQLYLEEERNQRATSAFGGKSVDASENVAFEVVIASIEPSKKESTVNEIQTDSSESLINDSQESEPKNSHLSLLNYNDENSFFDEFSHPRYQSTPGVFELVASKPLLHKKDNDDSSLYWHLDLKSLPSTPQEMFIKPLSLIPEHKSSASLSEKSHSQAVGLGKAQSALFQCDLDNEPFLPIGKVKSVPDLDLAKKVGSSNIFYPMKVSTSDSLVLQDLRRFEEVADSSNYILVKNVNSSNIIEGPSATVGSSFSANLVTCDAKSQGALPMTSNASLIAVGQESLLKADVGQGKIPRPMGAKSCFTINTIMQNDSYFVEGLQGKAESDTSTLDDDTECCNLDENAIGCSTRVADLQREVHEQGDLTAECIALAGFKNVLDDLEVCDSSLPWQSALELPSKEESDFEEPVGCSNMDINQTFSSVLPPFIPHEPTIELEYHSSDLRMLRVSPDTVQKTLKHIAGGTSKGGIAEVTQSSLKPGITAAPGDSDTGSHLSLFPEDFPQLDLRSPQENTVGQHTDTHNQRASVDSDISEETLKVSSVGERADQKTGISTVPSSFYSQRGKPSIFYPQALPDSHLAEEALKVSAVLGPTVQKSGIPTVFPSSYSRGENHIFYQQALPDSHLTEEALKVLAIPGPADQKTSIPIVLPSSYSHGEKRNTFYQQALPDSHLTEETLKYSAVPGSADQKTSIPTVLPSSYSHGETHVIFHPQALPHSHLTEEALKVSGVPHPTDQKTSIRTVPPSSYSCGEKHNIFYPQALPDSHLTEEALKVSAVPGPADQKTSIPTVLPSSYSRGEKHNIFYPQALPDSHLTEETLKISAVPVSTDQRTEKTIVPSTSYSQEKHIIFSQQQLSDGHLTKQVLKVSFVPGPADQNTGIPTLSSRSYSLGEKPNIFYQQVLPDSHLIEQTQKVAALPGPADQKTRIPAVSSTSYSHRERPHIFYQQTLPESHLTEQALKCSAPESTEQKTGIPTVTSTSSSHREKSSIFYQEELLDSHLTEQAQKVPAVPGPADQDTGIPIVPSRPYSLGEKASIFCQQVSPDSHLSEETLASVASGPAEKKSGLLSEASNFCSRREKHNIFYQEELPDSSLTEQAQKVSPVPEPTDQKTKISTVTSTSYSDIEKPFIFYPQGLSDRHLPEEALKVTAVSEPADQKSGIPVVPSTSSSHREKPIIFYPQDLTDTHLTEEALKPSAISGSADWKTGISTVSSTSYSPREKLIIFSPQALPGSHLLEEALKVSADQKTGLLSEPSSSYSHRKKPITFYPEGLTDGQLPQEALKVPAVSGPTDQKTELPPEPSSSYSPREKPIIFPPQALPGSHLLEEALKISAIPGSADQKTGLPSEPSSSYSHREKPVIFYPEGLTDGQVPQEALKVSAIPGPTDQKIGLPSEPSSSYSYREKPIIFYPQGLTDSQVSQEALKVSAIPGPADQKTGLPSDPSSSYSHREKPLTFYPQGLTDGQVPQEALKVSAVPGPADQKTGLPSEPSSSHSYREKPIIFYPQGLTDNRVPQEALKVSAIPGPADQKTGLPSEPSSSYSYREKPLIFYPQGLTDSQVPQKALKVSALPGPAAQKTGLLLEPSSSYSYREKPIIFYSQGLTDSRVPQEALKVSAIPGPADQKTGLPSEPSSSYSPREKPIIFYPQGLTDDHVPQEALKVSAIPGPTDKKIGLPSEPSSSYSHREKSNIFYQQELLGSHLTEETLKVSAVSATGDQKTGIPSSSYSLGGKPIIFCQQALSDRHLTEEALNVSASPEPADQETGIPTVPSVSYSHREKPSILYQQPLSDNQLPIEALKISAVSGPGDQKTRKPTITSASYSHREKPIIYQQELPDLTQAALSVFRVPGLGDQKTGIPVVTSTPYSHREKPIISYQQELPEPNEGALKVLGAPGSADQKTGIHIIPSSSYSYREKDSIFYQQELPDVTEGALKIFALPGPADQKTEIPTGSSSSYSHKEKLKISPVILPDDQKTELLTTPLSSYSQREKPKISTVIGPDNRTTPLLTVLHNSYSQRVKPFQQELPDGHHSEDILKISPVSEPTDVNSGIPIPLSSSYSHREKSNIFYPQELPDKHLAEDALKVSTIPVPADQKSLLPTVPPSSFSHREKPNIFYQQNFPDRHKTQDALMFSRGVGQVDQITGLSTVTPGTYSHSEKQKLVSDHVQMLIDNLDSSNSSVISNSVPLSSQADGRVVISKPESSGFEDVGSEENQDTSSGSKTLKEIRTLLMEAENIALKRCNFPAPLVPFRDVSDISFIQSKKVVCFKEPLTADESNGDLPQRQPFIEESPSDKCIQKDISTQTNLKCQRDIENWEFISSTTVRSPLQEAESKARVTVDETLRQYRADKSVMRSEPEGYSGTIGNKIVIPMMTIIKSDSSSDASSCSWDSNSLESVSDVLLNFIPYASPKTSLTDSREEEGVLESDDAGGSSVDSLAAHVRNLLKCESSLNHAKQILRNAEEEECRVRARAWNLKFNLAHECGYSISELNEDDRRKVEEIKAKLFGHERTTDLSKGLRSPRGIGYKPEAVCSHIIIESHEKGCFRTLTAEQPQLDSHPCVFRSADPSEMIRGQRSPSSWRTRHIDLSKSLDQSNSHFKVWNSLQLRSHSPFQNFTTDDFRISQGLRMPFHEKIDPWLSELVEPACVPPEEMDCHSSSQMLPPEPMKKFTTSITFSSHRHSKCFSDSSVLKVGVTEGSQCTGASVGVFNSHFTEEQNPPRDLEQRTSSPSSFKIVSHSPDKAVTILAESSRQSQKLSVEHSQQEEKLLERSDFKGSDSEPSTSAKCSNVKEVHFSDNHTFISMSRPSSTLGVKEKNVTVTPDLASHIILEQRELFEPSKASHADHHVRKYHSPPPQHQDYVAPNLPCRIFLEKRELFEQSQAPHLDHQMRENHSPFPQGQDYIASDLPSSIFLEQRQLFEQSKAPDVDHMGKYHSPLPPGQDYVVEKNNQHKFKSYVSNMINVEAKFDNVVSHSAPNQCTLVTSASTPPSNRKALSCVRITLYPKTPSKLDSGTLDKRFHSLDPASKTRMNSEFNSDLQTISSRSLEPTSKLLTGKPVAQNQESLGFLGPKSSPDFQVVQSPLPDSNTISQDLKNILFQNSQIVTSRQTQVNISDLEGYSSPEGTPVSADRPSEVIKTPFSAFPGKLSSDAVTQITTESPGKTMFSSEIFINADDRGLEIPEPSAQKLGKVPTTFASSSSVQQITRPHGTDAQPSLLPYKPPGSMKMYYVPQLKQIPSSLDSRSDTTIESSHSGSNDAIAPDFPAEVLGTRDDDLPVTDNIKHKEGIYSKRVVAKPTLPMGGKHPQKDNADAQVQVSIIGDEDISDKNQKKEIYNKKAVTKAAQPEEKESLQKTTEGSSGAADAEHSARLQDLRTESLPDTKAIKQKEEIHSKRTVPKESWTKEKESLQIDIAESRCHSEFENTTHSVFRSAKFYFHHPVHLPSDQDFCHESLGRSVFMRHSWKDVFQHHPDKQREHTRLPSPHQNVEKPKADYTRIESLSINVNLENEVMHTAKSQARDYPKSDKQINDQKKDHKVNPEPTAQHTVSLNELWNKYQQRQRQQKPPEFNDRKELSLVERLDRLAKLLQNPITYSLRTSESTQDDSRGERDVKEWSGRQQQQKNKLQKKKRYKSLEKFHKTAGELKKSKVLSTHQAGKPNQIKIEQIKFNKYILRKQPGFHYKNNTSSDSRPSEESELLTDTPTNIVSTTTSPVESDILTQTDREVALHERSSSISTIDTARLIQAFGQERVCLSPRRIKLYSSLTDHQRRYFERRNKNKKALNTGHPQMTSEHTRRKHIQVANHVISSDSVSSSTSSFCSSSSTLGNKQNVQMLNKSIQAGNLEIVNGVRKHTRDVGMTFPTPSSSEARIEEDSDVTSWSEEKIEEKRLLASYLGDKKLRKNRHSCCEGVSWFVPMENVKSGPKENLPKHHGPGICWFAPITNTKPWREPLREQNRQGQHVDNHGSLASPGRGPLKPFVRATLQESLQFHRPDFISRSGERIKRLKLIVQERKLQNMLQSEREALFNTAGEQQGYRDPTRPLLKRGFLDARKNRPVGKKEMIQRSKRIYEQLPEVQRKRDEEKRRLEYKSYRLRAQLFKKKVTNQLLGRKVPWN
ncbi:Alstrom syndrome protein 1 isoform X2 [Phoca vitulina]|uniref:Alstrom syndrome protein 1 isoform X2 n=1 Tax=Phoca vitulina TaxID=9720 RepID=UPI001396250B|nr:Alstrom syndrome protein 1 isoform X2 [Phoca vitulina]